MGSEWVNEIRGGEWDQWSERDQSDERDESG